LKEGEMNASLLETLEAAGGLRIAIAIAVVVAVLLLLRKLFSASEAPQFAVTATCPSCHWTGSMSKYRAVCPRCGSKVPL
jgi:ssDNA-binding Zn-finger/Zn-ribbon topoisomerase 1